MTEKEYPPTKGEQRQMMFKHWWKTDDPEWVAQRKREWKIIKANAYKEEEAQRVKRYAHFYVYGEVLPRIYMGARLDGVIDSSARLFMTPYETADQLRELFDSFSFNEKRSVLLDFLIKGETLYKGLSAEVARHDIKLFIQEVQGNHFAPWHLLDDFGRPETVGIKKPDFHAEVYIGECLSWLGGQKNGGYYYVVDAVEYFLEALVASEKVEGVDLSRLQGKLEKLVSLVMESKGKSLDGYKGMLVDNLYEAFTAERVPFCVQQALHVLKK